jgi:hypothetical protein
MCVCIMDRNFIEVMFQQTGEAQIRRESHGGESSSPDSGHCRGESPGGVGCSSSGDWTRGDLQVCGTL